jgi:IS5 family transposase
LSIAGAEEMTKVDVCEINVDKGFRGHNYVGQAAVRIAGSSNNGLSVSEKKRKRRRSAIEPVIGHLKKDHRLCRCMLKGNVGDGLNLIGSALGFNVKKLLRWLALGIYSRALWVCRVVDHILSSILYRTTQMGTLDSIH